jgi:hypothetical protein
MTFLELTIKVLKEIKRPLSADEIWEEAIKLGYDKELGSKGDTPEATIGSLIYLSMRDKTDNPFGKTGYRPTRFYLLSMKSEIELEDHKINPKTLSKKTESQIKITKQFNKQKEGEKEKILERELHPLLAYFAFKYFYSYTKTVNHRKSVKTQYAEWIHPDVVGCYYPLADWKEEVFDLSTQIGNSSIKIYSFEIKRELNLTNLREAFFQTVSNSSWANESYLVAAKVSNNEEFRNELKRLSISFGIGILRLNVEDPDSSEVILPAKYKENLDWEAINKLAINEDFTEFLKRVKKDISTKEIRLEFYDKVLEKEALINKLKRNFSVVIQKENI